jgi:hypothetical protein
MGGVGASKASTGLYVQASPVRRCDVGCSTRDVIDRGLAFGLYLNRDAGNLSEGGQYRRVRANVSCAAVRCGCSTRVVIDRGLAFGLYLICSAGILSGGVGARPVLVCTCKHLLCGGALWGAPLAS